MKTVVIFVALALVGSACSAAGSPSSTSEPTGSVPPASQAPSASTATTAGPTRDPSAPPAGVPDGPLSSEVSADLDLLFDGLGSGLDHEAVGRIGASGEVRLAWLLSDLLRFVGPGVDRDSLMAAFSQLTGVGVSEFNPWVESANLLIEWDLAEPPRYRELKGSLFGTVDERWAPFFDDPNSEIDYRLLNWGGVRPDDRPLGDLEATCRGGCIPALDDPLVTDASQGGWYPDDAIVFAVAFGGKARAYPKNIMETHEMVIDTVGGVRFGMPYCTLCGSAQAYDLESVPDGVEPPVLRTSGLLSRSNKVMYDLNTWSAFDTFTGRAVSGPLREAGVVLEQLTVVTATWGAWKDAHPDTTILAEDGGIGRPTRPTHWEGETTAARFSPLVRSIPGFPFRNSLRESRPRRVNSSPFPPEQRRLHSIPDHRWSLPGCGSSPTPTDSGPSLVTAPRWSPTKRSGSPGASSIPRPTCGQTPASDASLVAAGLISVLTHLSSTTRQPDG